MMTHNQKVKALTSELEKDLIHASSRQHLIEMIRKVQDFGTDLEYNNTMAYASAAFFALLAVIFCSNLFYMEKPIATDNGATFANALFMVLSVLIALFILNFNRHNFDLEHFSDQIFRKNVELDNGLKPIHDITLMNRWNGAFQELSRSSFKSSFPYLLEGNYQGQQHSFPFTLFCCESINNSDSNANGEAIKYSALSFSTLGGASSMFGRGRKRDQYLAPDTDRLPDEMTMSKPEYRFGLIVEFYHIQDLAILSTVIPGFSAGAVYKTEYGQFNDNFNIYGRSQLEIARILTPRFIELISQLTADFSELNLEFSHNNALCISFKNDDLLELQRTFGLDKPDLFILEINDTTVSGKLQKLLTCIEQMKTYSN